MIRKGRPEIRTILDKDPNEVVTDILREQGLL
jgi:hypothetical protein